MKTIFTEIGFRIDAKNSICIWLLLSKPLKFDLDYGLSSTNLKPQLRMLGVA